ncbi:23646_t:CDS:2 [Dentiscutata erythropus]|uniref:23646_t:CDS:1 n=1 Tax=Dentiscutata erythropus TaxID=1348616 RepID=A0A9N9IC21_9GLOM|nr:23646_t:CDS:2 [Dentiscutata erythropus]
MARIGNEKLKEIIELIIKDGWNGTITYYKNTGPALMWNWYVTEYIGAIHGVGSVLKSKKYPADTQSTEDHLIQ